MNKITKNFILSCILLLSKVDVIASSIKFTPNGNSNNGTIKGEVSLLSLGDIKLKDATALLNGRVISIKASDEIYQTPHTVLSGSLLRSEINLDNSTPSVTGLAFFVMGDLIQNIDEIDTTEEVFRNTGNLQGRILGVENDSLALRQRNGIVEKIPLSTILFIRSPRVYVFKLNLKPKIGLVRDSIFESDVSLSSFRRTYSPKVLSGSIIPETERNKMSNSAINSLKNLTPNLLFEDGEYGAEPTSQYLGPNFSKQKRSMPKMTLPPGVSME